MPRRRDRLDGCDANTGDPRLRRGSSGGRSRSTCEVPLATERSYGNDQERERPNDQPHAPKSVLPHVTWLGIVDMRPRAHALPVPDRSARNRDFRLVLGVPRVGLQVPVCQARMILDTGCSGSVRRSRSRRWRLRADVYVAEVIEADQFEELSDVRLGVSERQSAGA